MDKQEWKPIETAPKDGRWILGHNDGRIYRCNWDKPLEAWFRQDDTWCYPTHWMPLPEPPKP